MRTQHVDYRLPPWRIQHKLVPLRIPALHEPRHALLFGSRRAAKRDRVRASAGRPRAQPLDGKPHLSTMSTLRREPRCKKGCAASLEERHGQSCVLGGPWLCAISRAVSLPCGVCGCGHRMAAAALLGSRQILLLFQAHSPPSWIPYLPSAWSSLWSPRCGDRAQARGDAASHCRWIHPGSQPRAQPPRR